MKKIIALVIALTLGFTTVSFARSAADDAKATEAVKQQNEKTRQKFDIPNIDVKVPETKPVEAPVKSTDTKKSSSLDGMCFAISTAEAADCCPAGYPWLRNSTGRCYSSYSDCHNTNGGGWSCRQVPTCP